MIVVDSSALVAILYREPQASLFNTRIAEADPAFLSAVSLLETSMVLAGTLRGGSVWLDLDELVENLAIIVVPLDEELARVARDAFLRYGKGRHQARLNMGDCASYALAKSRDLPLLFKGDDFTRTDIARAA